MDVGKSNITGLGTGHFNFKEPTKPGEADLIPRMKSLICAKPIKSDKNRCLFPVGKLHTYIPWGLSIWIIGLGFFNICELGT